MIKLIRLTTPDGKDAVWVNPEQICTVTKSIDGDPHAKTAIWHVSGRAYVRETVEQVIQALVQ